MPPAELVQQRQQVQASQLVGRDDQLSPAQVPHIVHGRQRLFLQVEQSLGMLQQHLAGVGQHAAPAGTVEERLPDLVLEPLNDLADRRLRAVQGLGRLGKAAFPDDGDERLELEEVHLAKFKTRQTGQFKTRNRIWVVGRVLNLPV